MFNLKHLPNPVPEEELIFCLRRHPLNLSWLYVAGFLLVILPIAILGYVSQALPNLLASTQAMVLLTLFGSIFFLYAWLFLFQNFIDYALDLWIVTTKRILNIEQKGLFARTVSEVRLYRVQDVTATINGLVRTVFNYGHIEIQTAGEHERFVFEDVPNPNEVTKTILEYAEKDRREQLDEAVEEFAMPSQTTLEQEKLAKK